MSNSQSENHDDRGHRPQSVITALRGKATGRLLALDVGPDDGSVDRLVQVLSEGWPLSAQPLGMSRRDSPDAEATSKD